MVDYGEEIRKRGGEWRGDTLNAGTLLLLFGDRLRAATDGCFYVCYDQRGLVTFRSACQSRVNGRERAERWLIENWEKVMAGGCEDVSPVGSLPPVPDGYEAVGEWRLFSGKEYQYMPIEGRRWLLGNGDVTSCGVDFKMWARPIMEVDPIDAMSDAEAIAEVERVSGYKWRNGRAKAVSYLSPQSSVDRAYAVAFDSGRWCLWGWEERAVEVGCGCCEGGIDAAKACASRAILKHWRDNPSDAPKPKAKVHREDIDAAYQALHDAGISEPESLADGIRALTERADGHSDQLGEVRRALTDAGILDFDNAADGVRKLSEQASAKKRLAERWHLEWVKHDEEIEAVSASLSALFEFMEKHGRGDDDI